MLVRFSWPWRTGAHTDQDDTSPTQGLAAEAPIRSANDDLLSRATLAQRIASVVMAPTSGEGRVFAIRGSWGHGKSSLKNLVVEAMKAKDAGLAHLDFNPWQWGDGDAIARALFIQMAVSLRGSTAPDAAQRARALRRYGGMLLGSGTALNTASGDKGVSWLTGIAALAAAIGIGVPNLPVKLFAAGALGLAGIAGLLGRLLNHFGDNGAGTPLDDLRTDLERRLRALRKPLVVFVDDIDRLEHEQIRLLFRQIKVNANLPNIVFVLLYQPSIVEKALAPVAGSEGRQFLEKIVQAHFDLPAVAPERLFQIFGLELSRLVDELATKENGFEQTRWGNVAIGGIRPFIRNLRDVRRLIASIDIHLPLHRGTRVFEVNVIDFIALETLRVFEPSMHAALSPHRELLLQSQRFSGDGREQEHRAAIDALVDLASEERRKTCRDLLKQLFPTIEWAIGGMFSGGGGSWHDGWNEDKRVCTSRTFDRYFQLQSSDGSITASDFADFIDATSADQAEDAVSVLRDRGALAALASRLDESVQQLPLDHPSMILTMLLKLGEELSAAPGADGPFNTPFVACWRAASWYLRRIPEPAYRANLLLATMGQTRALATPATLISLDVESRTKADSRHDPLFDDEKLAELKQCWLETMRYRAACDPSLLTHDRLVTNLYRWREYGGSDEEPRAWVKSVAADPTRLPVLLTSFMSVGQQSGWGDHVATKTESFPRKTMEEFFDVEELTCLLASIDRRTLDPEQARVLGILDRHMEAWKRGERTDDW